MIWKQFKMLVWIRWRITINKLHKSGAIGGLLASLIVAMSVISVLVTFFGAIAGGTVLLNDAPPSGIFFTWAIVLAVMLVFWMIGLTTELQRSEVLSLKQLLHLPVGGRSIFLLNFASSFVCVTMLVFLPLMLGLAIAHVIVFGPTMLLLFPLLGSLLLLLTSATYQLRGWLALMMEDKRRAKNIAVLSVLVIIGLSQLPQAFSIYSRQSRSHRHDDDRAVIEAIDDFNAGKITNEELNATVDAQTKQKKDRTEQTFQLVYTVAKFIPPGWLPYGAYRLRSGDILPAILASIGSLILSSVCLWRGHSTTLRHCRGEFSTGKKTKVSTKENGKPIGRNWLETQLPFVSPETSAVAMMNLRNTSRAPEARMMLITPFLMFGIMMGSLFSSADKIPAFVNPFFALLFLWMGVVSMAQLTQNAFGLDRSGFRSFVLSPVPRRNILLGKNISVLPFSMVFGTLAILISQFVFPLSVDALLATIVQMLGLSIATACVANYASIWAPTAIAIGASRKAKPTLVAGLLQMVAMMCIPIASLPQIAACGIAVYCGYAEQFTYFPIYTIASLLALGLTTIVYWRLLPNQANALQQSELKILQRITSKDE
ncbi:hypothetical protein ACFL2H_11510 [Planctomycetota bacterium]